MSRSGGGEASDGGSLDVKAEKVLVSIMRFFASAGIPFSQTEGFSEHMSHAFPRCPFPSLEAMITEFTSAYHLETEKLKSCFQTLLGRVSITVSHYAGVQMTHFDDEKLRDYVCLTAHYVDNDWKLRKRIINFRLVRFREQNVCKSLRSWLTEWKVKKLFSMTVEKKVENTVAPLQIKNRLRAFVEPGGELRHIPCHADIFRLLASEALNSISDSLDRIRAAIQYADGGDVGSFSIFSPPTESKIYGIAKELEIDTKKQLYFDDTDLWHSTYLMLENALRYKEAFIRLESVDSDFNLKPTEDDWIKAREVCKFLKLYYKAAKLFSDRSTTADMYFFEAWKICINLKKESKNSDPFVSCLAMKMRDMFYEYWNNCFTMLAIATVFNPQHKMLMVEFCLQKLYGDSGSADPYIKSVQDGIQKLYDEYDSLHTEKMDIDDASSTSSNGDHDQFDDSFLADYKEFIEKYLVESQKSELQLYLDEKVLHPGDRKFDILAYWKLNESRFPKLARVARDVLAIPIMAVASDSVFFIGNRVIGNRYCWRGPANLEMSICLQNWLHEPHPTPQATIMDGGYIFDEDDYVEHGAEEEEEEDEGDGDEGDEWDGEEED